MSVQTGGLKVSDNELLDGGDPPSQNRIADIKYTLRQLKITVNVTLI